MSPSIILNASTLKNEVLTIIGFIEDGDITAALRQLRAMYASVELQAELQGNALEAVQKALDRTRHLEIVERENND